MPAIGRPKIDRNDSLQLRKQDVRLQTLAQGLRRSLSAFSNFMREYIDKVIEADQCAQYVDGIGIAAISATQLIRTIRAVFDCIRKAGLKLTIEKTHFGVTEVEILGRFITPQGIAP